MYHWFNTSDFYENEPVDKTVVYSKTEQIIKE